MHKLPIGMAIYPRGFLGADLGKTLQADNYQDPAERDFIYNVNVAEIYAEHVRRPSITLTLDFREKALRAAITAFGTKRIDIWFENQFKSPGITNHHARFLDDTINFVRYGERLMPIEIWENLLSLRTENDNNAEMTTDIARYFNIRPGNGDRYNISIYDFFVKWCEKPGGLEDIIATSRLLFGPTTTSFMN